MYPIDVISVRASEGTPADYSVETEGDYERIKIGDPDTTITGEHQYEITYRVRGALNAFKDHDELVWNAIGIEWPVPIAAANVDRPRAGRDHRRELLAGPVRVVPGMRLGHGVR